MQLGGHGVISVTLNAVARDMAAEMQAKGGRSLDEARLTTNVWMPLYNKYCSNPIRSLVKWAYELDL